MTVENATKDETPAGAASVLTAGLGAWLPIATAPRDGTVIQAQIPGHGSDNMILWANGLIDSAGNTCGGWAFADEQESPDCWTGGICWTVNEDGEASVQPTSWKTPTRWLPIETAPKDGTHVVLHNCRDLPATCHWFDGAWHLSMNRYGPFSEWTWTEPTHWMPLPEAPNVELRRLRGFSRRSPRTQG